MNFIKNQYNSAGAFFKKRLAFTFWICLGSFIAITAAFMVGLSKDADTVNRLVQQIMKAFQAKNIVNGTNISFGRLLLNNLMAAFMPMLMGCIPFLFLPVISLVSNAAIIGILGAMMQMNQRSLLVFFVAILPHGIFEIPALLLGMAAGIQICKTLVKKIIGRAKPGECKETFAGVLKTYLLLIVPLLTVAALIETYITPALLKMFM